MTERDKAQERVKELVKAAAEFLHVWTHNPDRQESDDIAAEGESRERDAAVNLSAALARTQEKAE